MEDITKLIVSFLKGLERIEFSLTDKHASIDFEGISLRHYEEINVIENKLLALYLNSNEEIILRTKSLLIEIKQNLKATDYGLRINFEGSEYTIEPIEIQKLVDIKIGYIDGLINITENFFHSRNKSEKDTIPAKYYALYHWIKIELGIEAGFERNEDDNYPKKQIEAFAQEKYPKINSQSFYRVFKDINIKNKLALANTFGRGYKEIVISLSNNDARIITALKKYPN